MNIIEKIAIFGATGMTGVCVLQEALSLGYKVKLLLREPSKLIKLPDEYKDKVEIVKGDVTNPEDVMKALSKVDAVIVVLGTRNNLEPTTVLSRGLQNIINSMKELQISLISVCLSSFLFYDPQKVPPIFKYINEEHGRMLDILKSSNLQYIAVFPPHIDQYNKGEYKVKHNKSPGGRVVSKWELADFLVKSLTMKEHYGQIVGICSESSIPKDQVQ